MMKPGVTRFERGGCTMITPDRFGLTSRDLSNRVTTPRRSISSRDEFGGANETLMPVYDRVMDWDGRTSSTSASRYRDSATPARRPPAGDRPSTSSALTENEP